MAIDKKRLLHQARKLVDGQAKEKELERSRVSAEIDELKQQVASLNVIVDSLRNLKSTEAERLLAVKTQRQELLDKIKGLDEELDGTAERRRLEMALDASKAQVSWFALMLMAARQ